MGDNNDKDIIVQPVSISKAFQTSNWMYIGGKMIPTYSRKEYKHIRVPLW